MGGAAVGAIGCGPLMKYGKLKVIHMMNALMLIGIALCMIDILPVIYVGRFIWGFSFGCFSAVCPKYNNEICPIEYRGPFGAISQLMLTFGNCIPSTMALGIPITCTAADKEDFMITGYWRVIWLVPAVIAVLHSLLIMFCFNHESPVWLME